MLTLIKWLTGLIFVALIILVVFLASMGAFSTPQAVETAMGPYTYVYEEFTGDYKKTGPVFDRVYAAVKAEGVESTVGIGIYLDNPRTVPAEKLRSLCGTVITEEDLAAHPALANVLKVGRIDRQESVVVQFPLKSPLSYMIGAIKAYPALARYAQSKGYKAGSMYELYDVPDKTIRYVMTINKQ